MIKSLLKVVEGIAKLAVLPKLSVMEPPFVSRFALVKARPVMSISEVPTV